MINVKYLLGVEALRLTGYAVDTDIFTLSRFCEIVLGLLTLFLRISYLSMSNTKYVIIYLRQ